MSFERRPHSQGVRPEIPIQTQRNEHQHHEPAFEPVHEPVHEYHQVPDQPSERQIHREERQAARAEQREVRHDAREAKREERKEARRQRRENRHRDKEQKKPKWELPLAASVDPEAELTVGRRAFLKGALGVVAVATLDSWLTIDEDNDVDKADSEQKTGLPESEVQAATKQPLTDTSDQDIRGDIPRPEVVPEDENENLDQQQTSKKHETLGVDRSKVPNPIRGPLSRLDRYFIENQGYGYTVRDAGVKVAGNIAYSTIANNDHVRLYSGNSADEEIVEAYRDNRLGTILRASVKAPLKEELLFRGLPMIGSNPASLLPLRGIASSYIFGKAHQLESIDDLIYDRRNAFNQDKIPVQQHIAGGFYWMMARRRGLSHSMLAHAVNNTAAIPFLEYDARKK